MPEGRDGLARGPEGDRPDRSTPPQETHWRGEHFENDLSFKNVPPPPRVGRGHRTTAENMAGRELLTSYGAHMEHLTEAALSATIGRSATHPGAAAEVSKRNSQLEFMKEWGKTRYIGEEYSEEGTEGQFQDSSDLTGGRFGRLAGSSGSGMVRDVFAGTPSSMSGFTAPLSGGAHNPPPPSQTVSGSESYPAFKPLPPGLIRPPNK